MSWIILNQKTNSVSSEGISNQSETIPEETIVLSSKDTVSQATKNIHTTHPQSQVEQSNALVTKNAEPVKQQEYKTVPAAFNNNSEPSSGLTDTGKITLIQPAIDNKTTKEDDNLKIPIVAKETVEIATDPCNGVVITAEVTVEKSCIEKATGKIIIDKESIQGGEPPYDISLNNDDNFINQLLFSKLTPGFFKVFIRDKNKCINLIEEINLESKTCAYEFIFAPEKGEVWQIPEYEIPFTINIYSKDGRIVFTEKIDFEGNYEWTGRTNTGDELPMGAYMFVLESDSEEPFYGTITLIR